MCVEAVENENAWLCVCYDHPHGEHATQGEYAGSPLLRQYETKKDIEKNLDSNFIHINYISNFCVYSLFLSQR